MSGGLSIDFGGYKTVELGRRGQLHSHQRYHIVFPVRMAAEVFVYSTTPPLALFSFCRQG